MSFSVRLFTFRIAQEVILVVSRGPNDSRAKQRPFYETLSTMAKWKQYELWVQTAEDKWDMVGQFPNAELPTAMAKARSNRTRLIEVQYDGSRLLGQELVLE